MSGDEEDDPRKALTAPIADRLPEAQETLPRAALSRSSSTAPPVKVVVRPDDEPNPDAPTGVEGFGDEDEDGNLPAGTVLAGKYKIVRLLGAGGMGQVYQAEHLSLGVPIALKTMRPIFAAIPQYVRRFRREAHACSRLNHPNVVRVLDFGEEGELLYIVMEFLEGTSLAHYLHTLAEPPPLREVVSIMGMLFDALDIAHGQGIIHRDLKPENVFMTAVGDQTLVKVLDFGIAHVDDARDAGPTLTAKDAVAGTPDYMSPEQCRSLAVGPSADLYSLGCVLTTLLQLAPPFRSASPIETMAKHMFSPPPALRRPESAEPVPPLLEKLRLELLAKLPEGRPKSAARAKVRLLEAMSKDVEERRLPARKGDVLAGDRSERAPVWEAAGAKDAPVQRPAVGARALALVRVGLPGERIGPECETGLSMRGMEVIEAKDAEDVHARGLAVVLLDAGSNLAGAHACLTEIAKLVPTARVVVCAADLTAPRISGLVALGAADVLRYPVTPDTLAQKLDRVLRRGR